MNDLPKTPQMSAANALAEVREALRRLRTHPDAPNSWSIVGRAIFHLELAESELAAVNAPERTLLSSKPS